MLGPRLFAKPTYSTWCDPRHFQTIRAIDPPHPPKSHRVLSLQKNPAARRDSNAHRAEKEETAHCLRFVSKLQEGNNPAVAASWVFLRRGAHSGRPVSDRGQWRRRGPAFTHRLMDGEGGQFRQPAPRPLTLLTNSSSLSFLLALAIFHTGASFSDPSPLWPRSHSRFGISQETRWPGGEQSNQGKL